MTDVMTSAQRSRVMSRIRGKNTSPERYLAELLDASGVGFTRHAPELPGKPDFVFAQSHLVVFVDGDFWHGWRFPLWQHRLAPFWRDKIGTNRARDRRNFNKLRKKGWDVLRIWEHQIETDILKCVRRIAAFLDEPLDMSLVEQRYGTMPPLKRRKRLPKP